MLVGLSVALVCAIAAVLFLWTSRDAGRRAQAGVDTAELAGFDALLNQLSVMVEHGQHLFEQASLRTEGDSALVADIDDFHAKIDDAAREIASHSADELLNACDLNVEHLFRDLRAASAAIREFHAAEHRGVEGEPFRAEARRASALLAQLKLDLDTADLRVRQSLKALAE
jgi:hypothetical protein